MASAASADCVVSLQYHTHTQTLARDSRGNRAYRIMLLASCAESERKLICNLVSVPSVSHTVLVTLSKLGENKDPWTGFDLHSLAQNPPTSPPAERTSQLSAAGKIHYWSLWLESFSCEILGAKNGLGRIKFWRADDTCQGQPKKHSKVLNMWN